MTDKASKFVEALESEATEQLDAVREYRVYKGNNQDYAKRAKLAIGVIGAYVRLRATMANERSNDLIERRLLSGDGIGQAQIGDGK
jgi:hypothetical protein